MRKIVMEKVIKEHNYLMPRSHWFDKSTMRFFGCSLPQYAYQHEDNYFFITGEKMIDGGRFYTVRKMDAIMGDIETIEEFNQYTRTHARALMAQLMNCKVKDL